LQVCHENIQIQNQYAQLRFGRSAEEQEGARYLAPQVDEANWRAEKPLNEILWTVAPKLEQIGIEPAKFCIKSGSGDTLDTEFSDYPSGSNAFRQ
jgi:hypothetical protein